jgi:hypothetical protein
LVLGKPRWVTRLWRNMCIIVYIITLLINHY